MVYVSVHQVERIETLADALKPYQWNELLNPVRDVMTEKMGSVQLLAGLVLLVFAFALLKLVLRWMAHTAVPTTAVGSGIGPDEL